MWSKSPDTARQEQLKGGRITRSEAEQSEEEAEREESKSSAGCRYPVKERNETAWLSSKHVVLS